MDPAQSTSSEVSFTHHLISSLDDLKSCLSYLSSFQGPIAIDTETTGLERDRKVIGIGLAPNPNEGFYIPLWLWNGTELFQPWANPEEVRALLKEFITNHNSWLGHNIVFDAISIQNELGVNIIKGVHCDTQHLAHLVYNEEGPLGLKPLSTQLFNIQASSSQDEVKESIKANGGKATKDSFEIYKADWKLVGKYCCYDVHYTYRIYELLYPEIEKQGFSKIWFEEVLPLSQVTYELNSEGFPIDLDYFNKLKNTVIETIQNIEKSIFTEIEPHIQDYITNRVKESTNFTSRSQFGRSLIAKGLAKKLENSAIEILDEKAAMELAKEAYAAKKPLFNLDSGDDKAFLIYDVLKLPCPKTTESGKRSTDAKTMDTLCAQFEDKSPVLKMMLHRAKERKILSTYVESVLDNQVNGRIYTSFRQTGTISGRYSSGDPINFQNLPRDDKRIKKGFVPEAGYVLIGDDYESAEPKAFAFVSGEQKLKDIFALGHDFYSTIAIQVEQLENVSADPKDPHFLKNLDPKKRQSAKAYSLGIPYGMRGGKLSMQLGIEYMEAQNLVEQYLEAFPKLAEWMYQTDQLTLKQGYVTSIYGRRRRASTVHQLHKKYGIKDFTKKSIAYLVDKYRLPNDPLELYLECNNNLNNAKNFQIQSICASIINKAMIDFQNRRDSVCPSARLLMMIHDEIVITAKKEEAEAAAALLQDCMENNEFAKRLDVKMVAHPVITDKNLGEAK